MIMSVTIGLFSASYICSNKNGALVLSQAKLVPETI